MDYVLQTRLPLFAWTQIGPRARPRPGWDKATYHDHRAANLWQHQCRQLWEALENSSLSPLMHFPPDPFILPSPERSFIFLSSWNTLYSLQGTKRAGQETRGHALPRRVFFRRWVVLALRLTQDPTAQQGDQEEFQEQAVLGELDSLVEFLQAQGKPGLHFGESRIKHCLKLLCSLKRTDFRFWRNKQGTLCKDKAFPDLGGQVLQGWFEERPKERGNSGPTSGLELRCLQVTLKWWSKSCRWREWESKCGKMLTVQLGQNMQCRDFNFFFLFLKGFMFLFS